MKFSESHFILSWTTSHLFLISLLLITTLGIIPKKIWNDQAVPIKAQIISYDIDLYGTQGMKNEGFLNINFWYEIGNKFVNVSIEICKRDKNKYKYEYTNDCKAYLNEYYPIGEEISIYYNPLNYEEIRESLYNLIGYVIGIIIFAICYVGLYVSSSLLLCKKRITEQ